MLDPVATGPLLRLDLLANGPATTVIPFFFVLLGDLRVLWLALGVARPDRSLASQLLRALGLSLIVPVFAGATYGVTRLLVPEVHSQLLWMLYEAGFLVLCILLSRRWAAQALRDAPATESYVQALLGFSAAYYVLWLTADLLISSSFITA